MMPHIYLILSCIFLAGCASHKQSTVTLAPQADQPVTLMVHGTRMLPLISCLLPGLSRQLIIPPGLHKPDELGWTYAMTRLARSLGTSDPVMFPYANIYLFGWSGVLSFAERATAGEQLYHHIKELQKHPQYKKSPFKLITISHGGNVALNMARVAQEKNDVDIHIDELILLCSPVQDMTENYIESPIFKKVFNLFSHHDLVQIADPQGLSKEVPLQTKTLLSRRWFETASPHIIQAEVRQAGAPLGHAEFGFPGFMSALPLVINELNNSDKHAHLPKNKEDMPRVDFRKLVKAQHQKKDSRHHVLGNQTV